MDVLCCPVLVEAFVTADHSSKESCQVSKYIKNLLCNEAKVLKRTADGRGLNAGVVDSSLIK
jgi:hypothetical protein